MIRFHLHAVGGLRHRHGDLPRQDLRQGALVVRVQVLDEYERHAGIRLSIWVNASMPPAEAPIPTMGNVMPVNRMLDDTGGNPKPGTAV